MVHVQFQIGMDLSPHRQQLRCNLSPNEAGIDITVQTDFDNYIDNIEKNPIIGIQLLVMMPNYSLMHQIVKSLSRS